MASGLYRVEAGEAAVVYRFGAARAVERSGLHLRAPWPIEAHTQVAINEVRRVEGGRQRLLTADTNLIELELVLQYTVQDPAAWLVGAADPDAALRGLLMAEATAAVGQQVVDELLTTGRAELERHVAERVGAAAAALQLGVRVGGVEVKDLSPPAPVRDAFTDVSSARGDRETLALGADGYVSQALPAARGLAATQRSAAQATAAARVAQARGDVARFEALRAAHAAAPGATRNRLWVDSLGRLRGQTRVQSLPAGAVLELPPPAAGRSAP